MLYRMVYYIPMRGRGLEEKAAVRAEPPPSRYLETKRKATLGVEITGSMRMSGRKCVSGPSSMQVRAAGPAVGLTSW